jgi:hypothetical protein
MKQEPLDFDNVSVAEFLTSKVLPFIRNENISSEEAHREFLVDMFMAEWKPGAEDFPARVHPDLIDYCDLLPEAKQMYAFLAGIVASAREFYLSLKADLEAEFMDSINSTVNGKPVTGLHGNGVTH